MNRAFRRGRSDGPSRGYLVIWLFGESAGDYLVIWRVGRGYPDPVIGYLVGGAEAGGDRVLRQGAQKVS